MRNVLRQMYLAWHWLKEETLKGSSLVSWHVELGRPTLIYFLATCLFCHEAFSNRPYHHVLRCELLTQLADVELQASQHVYANKGRIEMNCRR